MATVSGDISAEILTGTLSAESLARARGLDPNARPTPPLRGAAGPRRAPGPAP